MKALWSGAIALGVCLSGCGWISGLSELKVRSEAADAGSQIPAHTSSEPSAEESGTASGSGSAASSTDVSASFSASASGASASASLSAAPDAGPPHMNDTPNECELLDGAECDPIADCGCEAPKTCTIAGNGDPTCLAPGNQGLFDACSRPRDCAAGYYCADGLCVEPCLADADCELEGSTCIAANAAKSEFGHCRSACDLEAPQTALGDNPACGDGATCVALRDKSGKLSGSECAAQGTPTTDGVWCRVSGGLCAASPGFECVAQGQIGNAQFGHCEALSCFIASNSPCGVLPSNCGCGAGQQCQVVDSAGGTACVAIGGSPLTGSCADDSDCASGLTCVGFHCRPYCDDNRSCVEGPCVAITWDDAATSARFCTGRCDAVNPSHDDATVSPCAAADHCEPELGDSAAGASCYSGTRNPQAPGGDCATPADCSAGAGCVCENDFECTYFAGTCRAYCNRDADCPGQASCIATAFSSGFCCALPYAGAPCSLDAQCGCAVGEQCVNATGGATKCVSRHALACTTDAECGSREVCAAAQCRTLCSGPGGACAVSGETCAQSMLSDGTPAYACQQ